MKLSKLKFVILLAFLFSLFVQCQVGDTLLHPLGGQAFWLRDFSKSSQPSYQVQAVFLASGKHIELYQEINSKVKLISVKQAKNLLSEFENNSWKKLISLFGKPLDIDNNNKIIVLLADIKEKYSESGNVIGGYFDPYNEYKDIDVFKQTGFHSNEKEIVYLDIYSLNKNSTQLYSTLAHEFFHLLHFSSDYKQLQKGTKTEFEKTWISEGLAEMASDIAGYKEIQKQRWNNFTFSLSLTQWSNLPEDYSSSYAFFRFLSDNFSNNCLRYIVANPLTGEEELAKAILSCEEKENTELLPANSTEKNLFNYLYASWISALFNWENNSLSYKLSYTENDSLCVLPCSLNNNLKYNNIPDFTDAHPLSSFTIGENPEFGFETQPYTPFAFTQYDSDEPEFAPSCTANDSEKNSCALIYTSNPSNEANYLIMFHSFEESHHINIISGITIEEKKIKTRKPFSSNTKIRENVNNKNFHVCPALKTKHLFP